MFDLTLVLFNPCFFSFLPDFQSNLTENNNKSSLFVCLLIHSIVTEILSGEEVPEKNSEKENQSFKGS